jgi:hypothetical protein
VRTQIDFSGLEHFYNALSPSDKIEIERTVKFIAGLALELNEDNFDVSLYECETN